MQSWPQLGWQWGTGSGSGAALGSQGRAPVPPALLKLEQICPTGWVLVLHCPRDRAQREDRAGAGQGGQGWSRSGRTGLPRPSAELHPPLLTPAGWASRTLLCWHKGCWFGSFSPITACPLAGNGGIATPAAPGHRAGDARLCSGAQRSRQAALLCRC